MLHAYSCRFRTKWYHNKGYLYNTYNTLWNAAHVHVSQPTSVTSRELKRLHYGIEYINEMRKLMEQQCNKVGLHCIDVRGTSCNLWNLKKISDTLLSFRNHSTSKAKFCTFWHLCKQWIGGVGQISKVIFRTNHLCSHNTFLISNMLFHFETRALQRRLVSKTALHSMQCGKNRGRFDKVIAKIKRRNFVGLVIMVDYVQSLACDVFAW